MSNVATLMTSSRNNSDQNRRNWARKSVRKLGQAQGAAQAEPPEVEQDGLQAQVLELEARPAELKQRIQRHWTNRSTAIEPEWRSLQLHIPQPPDVGRALAATSADDNVEIRRWAPEGWNWDADWEANRGFPGQDASGTR